MVNSEDRGGRWVRVSIGLMRFEMHMMPLIQQLGRIDVRLIEADETWPERFFNRDLTYERGLSGAGTRILALCSSEDTNHSQFSDLGG